MFFSLSFSLSLPSCLRPPPSFLPISRFRANNLRQKLLLDFRRRRWWEFGRLGGECNCLMRWVPFSALYFFILFWQLACCWVRWHPTPPPLQVTTRPRISSSRVQVIKSQLQYIAPSPTTSASAGASASASASASAPTDTTRRQPWTTEGVAALNHDRRDD